MTDGPPPSAPRDTRDIRRADAGEKARTLADLRAAMAEGTYRTDAHAVVIGIDRYADEGIPPLRYARADAEAVYAALVDPEVGRFDPGRVALLVDAQATRAAILTAVGALRKNPRDRDTVVIYFAGHGAPEIDVSDDASDDGLQKFLVPYDAQRSALYATAIPMDEVQRMFGRIRSRSLVFLLDACYSGNAGGRSFAREGVGTRAMNISDRFLKAMAGEGRCVITSCDVNEVSIESTEYEHGLFTHYLLRGLRGGADADGDGAVDVEELYRYLSREVPEAAGRCGAKMQPVLTGEMRGSVVLSIPETPALRRAREMRTEAVDAQTRGDLESAGRLWREAASLDLSDSIAPTALALIDEQRERTRRAHADAERQRREELARQARVLREHFEGGQLTEELFAYAVEVLEADAPTLQAVDRSLRRLVDALVAGQMPIERFNKAATVLTRAWPATGDSPAADPQERVSMGPTRVSPAPEQSAPKRAAAQPEAPPARMPALPRDTNLRTALTRAMRSPIRRDPRLLVLGAAIVLLALFLTSYRETCEGGSARGCSRLGYNYEHGLGVPQDVARAATLYRRSCEGGDAQGCSRLGYEYEHGLGGVPRDPDRAAALYQQGCDDGDAQGCSRLGYEYDTGQGVVPHDEVRAVALYRRSCTGGDAQGCMRLGYEYEKGLGSLTQDDARAVALYRQGCDGGNAQGCANLGRMYEQGRGGAVRNEARALALFRQSCDSGNTDGCDYLKSSHP